MKVCAQENISSHSRVNLHKWKILLVAFPYGFALDRTDSYSRWAVLRISGLDLTAGRINRSDDSAKIRECPRGIFIRTRGTPYLDNEQGR